MPRYTSNCLFTDFGFLQYIILALNGLSEVQITKYQNNVSICTLEGTNCRASGIMGYVPQLLKYHVAPCLWFSDVHIKCYLGQPASTISAGSTGKIFHFTDNYYLVKHLFTGLNINNQEIVPLV